MEKTINLLNHKFVIKLENPGMWSVNGMGRSNIKSGEILVDKTMSAEAIRSTIIHEVVHLIADLNSVELSEQSVDNLTLGILSLLVDNKGVIPAIDELILSIYAN